jgi:Fungal Zn(2)-Cys(6) binuclear cluster domain
MTNALKPRVRRLAPKTRSGCKTCKRRRVKCDERHPTCLRCEKLELTCEGYEPPRPWLFEPRSSSSASSSPPAASLPNEITASSLDGGATDASPSPSSVIIPHRLSDSTTILSEQPRPFAMVTIKDSEDLFLMQMYVQFAAKCPVAWESDLYGPKQNISPGEMTNKDIIALNRGNPVTRVGHLAMATATLHLFQPQTFPAQLQIKYLQLAIVEVRKRILKHDFDVTDLLHGISKIFLASVLIGDEVAARAHLKAAKELVDQRGGLDAICAPTAQALKYGDLHLAVETVSSPMFLIAPTAERHYDSDLLPKIDPSVLRLCKKIQNSAAQARHLISDALVLCYCNFVDCVIALMHALSEGPGRLDFGKLEYVGRNCLATCDILLRMSKLKDPTLTAVQEDARHTLVLWIQLLSVIVNSWVTVTDVRSHTIVISKKVFSHGVSPAVRYGLKQWNHLVSSAKLDPQDREERATEDLLQLVQVVSNMEMSQPVRVGPLMSRVSELKQIYRGIKLSPRAAVDAIQATHPGIIYEG